MMTTSPHPGAMALRRVLAQEAVEAATAEHVETCAACKARLDQFRAEQRAFEAAVPFERFSAGVEKAQQHLARAEPARRWGNLQTVLALAAAVAVLAGGERWLHQPTSVGTNHLKGGAGVELVVSTGPNGAQRVATESAPEALGPGERVRIGVTPAAWHFVMVVSIDSMGTVTPVYAASGKSLPLSGQSPEFLPDSLEFTGAGLEHVVVVLSDRALDADVVGSELRRQFTQAKGDLTKLEGLDLPGEQFHRTFLKP